MNFSSLIKQEWIKLRSMRSLIFLIICVLINVAFILVAFNSSGLPPEDGSAMTADLVSMKNPFGLIMRQFSASLGLVASMFFILQYGDEFKHGLIRKNVIDGMARRDIFNGKMVFLFGSYLMWTLLLVVLFLICGVIVFKGDFGLLVQSIQIEQLIKYYLHVIFYGAFAFFLVSVTRSASVSLIIFLVYIMVVENLIMLGCMYFGWMDAIAYLPVELAKTIRESDIISYPQLFGYMGYLVAFFGIGQLAIYKRDL